eukprot:2472431-Rhodomonas_salina.1
MNAGNEIQSGIAHEEAALVDDGSLQEAKRESLICSLVQAGATRQRAERAVDESGEASFEKLL